MNLTDEDVVKFQMRDFIAKNPEKARAILAAAANKASLPQAGGLAGNDVSGQAQSKDT